MDDMHAEATPFFDGTVAVIGAGPAGLATALELLRRTNLRPVVFESSDALGGISRTVTYRGNRIDIGGHRFFSKSDRVLQWWLDILPIQKTNAFDNAELRIAYQGKSRNVDLQDGPDPDQEDKVFLIRSRSSRIYHDRKFLDYPIHLSWDTISKLGMVRTFRIGMSYLRSVVAPIRPEDSLEHFYINRFGRELYRTFFKDYTQKVWGIECSQISAAWGAQRVKGLSVSKSISHYMRTRIGTKIGLEQKDVETSLIEHFLYPKYGPGQMWEEVANHVLARGGEIRTRSAVDSILTDGTRVTAVRATDTDTGEAFEQKADYVVSSMPVQDLIRGLVPEAPPEVMQVAEGLIYRDFITVGILARMVKTDDANARRHSLLNDTWIYVQESDVKVGRIQVFNNWSPYMVADSSNIWLGMEFFCSEGDSLWSLSDPEMKALAAKELVQLGFVEGQDVQDAVVIRQPKAYPAYFGSYVAFDVIREYVDQFENLFLVGRNGLHKYNNQDHSVLTAMLAVDNIVDGRNNNDTIWDVDLEQEYHERK